VARRPKGSRLGPERWGALQTDRAHPYLQKREIARREGQLEDTRDAALTVRHRGAASRVEPTGVQPWRFTGVGLTLALGCAWSRPTHFHSLHKKARRDGRLTGVSFDDGEHKNMDCPGATRRRGRLYARLGWPAARPRARCGAWPQPCSRTRGLTMPTRRGRLVSRGAARDGAAAHPPFPAQQSTARRPVSRQVPRTATAAHKGMSGPGAPARRGTTVLRHEGQHTGRVIMATRLDIAGASQERDQGGGKERTTAAVLTMGRRCSHGRLGGEIHVGGVGVRGGGLPQLRLLAHGRSSVLPARRGGGAPSFSSSHGAHRGERGKKTPMGLVAWRLGFRPLPSI
jgi:hypothetical protein